MGLYDRQYYREEDERSGYFSGSQRPLTVDLIIVTCGIYLADMIVGWQLTKFLALSTETVSQPWRFYSFLTYGFVHSPGVAHILFNMLTLFFFGRIVEQALGRAEFMRVYLSLILSAGVVWFVAYLIGHPEALDPNEHRGIVYGASGGVVGICVIFVMKYPHQVVHIMGVLPVPAWLLIVFFVVGDVLNLLRTNPGNKPEVAYMAHLGGAAFGALYYKTGWCLASLIPRRLKMPSFKRRPKLRIHDDDPRGDDRPREDNWQQRVDEILAKIHRDGESSLTNAERKTLEEASRRYQQRRS